MFNVQIKSRKIDSSLSPTLGVNVSCVKSLIILFEQLFNAPRGYNPLTIQIFNHANHLSSPPLDHFNVVKTGVSIPINQPLHFGLLVPRQLFLI